MKFTKKDFLQQPNRTIEIDEVLAVEESEFLHQTQVKSIPRVHVRGTLQFDGSTTVFSDLEMDGDMIVLDSITAEDVEVAFDARSQSTYSFVPVDQAEANDVIVVKKETIDLNPEIVAAVVWEAPMSITRLSREQYPSGEG